jgi:4-hydroxybutyrate CoA-transferase
MTASDEWQTRGRSAAEVVSLIPPRAKVFVQGAAATPTTLLDALSARTDLDDVSLYHLHLAGPAAFLDRSTPGVRSYSLFTGPNLRRSVEEGRAEYIPVFLSDIPALFTARRIPLDAALVQLSPPDAHGNCTLGTSVDAARSAADSAPILLAEINQGMPRTHGNTVVPFERITAFVATDRPLHAAPSPECSEVEQRIGAIVAALVPDGATLQMGIGAIPDAVLSRLGNKHDLSVHTEMFSDGLIPLIRGGVVTNRHKLVLPGRTVTSFVSGTQRLYDFVHDNLGVEFHPCDRTNDTALIRRNPRVCAINSALEVDLTGQVCADSIGHRVYSGIGGQMDFIRGAALSEGGKAIIALPATAASGQVSRIVSSLKPGAGVVTTRGHVHYVVTEYGAADLHGLSLRQRAEALIAIAHPDFRAALRREANGLRHWTL